jgi:hypothetical protein
LISEAEVMATVVVEAVCLAGDDPVNETNWRRHSIGPVVAREMSSSQ